jgi:NDP-sugar pyrophosphorylase family protein
LLEFGGRTLLEWHAARLREVGVTDAEIARLYRDGSVA